MLLGYINNYIPFGGVYINDILYHLANPHLLFCGVGASGMRTSMAYTILKPSLIMQWNSLSIILGKNGPLSLYEKDYEVNNLFSKII